MPKAWGYKVKAPKAKLSKPVEVIQKVLWRGEVPPAWCRPYRYSSELMKIYKILIDMPRAWSDSIEYELDPEEKVHLVFGTDYRNVYSYEAIEDFKLTVGRFKEEWAVLDGRRLEAARTVRKQDLILIRHDTREESLTVDLQILSDGLLQDDSEDFKVFVIDSIDLKHIRPKLKLVDAGGVYEPEI